MSRHECDCGAIYGSLGALEACQINNHGAGPAPHPTAAEIRGAIARAWCAKPNQHKVVDPDLAEAATLEVLSLLGSRATHR